MSKCQIVLIRLSWGTHRWCTQQFGRWQPFLWATEAQLSGTVMGTAFCRRQPDWFLSLGTKSRSTAFVITYSRSFLARAVLVYSLYPPAGSLNLCLTFCSFIRDSICLWVKWFVMLPDTDKQMLSSTSRKGLVSTEGQDPYGLTAYGLLCWSYKIFWLFRVKIAKSL